MRKYLPMIIGLLVFAYLLYNIDIKQAFHIILTANMPLLIFATLLCIPILLLVAYRWHYILKYLGGKYPFSETYQFYASSIFIGFVTPARVGEFVRVAHIKDQGYGRAFASGFADRFSDFLFVLGASFIGMIYFSAEFQGQITIAAVMLGITIFIIIFSFLKRKLIEKWVFKLLPKFLPKKLSKLISANIEQFHDCVFALLKVEPFIITFLLTLAAWLIFFFQLYLTAISLGIYVNVFYLATMSCIASLLALLPISISGIGTRDATFVLLLGLVGIEKEFAIALSLIVLLQMTVQALICFPYWIRKPVKIDI
jgi:glycosyltransferase 2 family protein